MKVKIMKKYLGNGMFSFFSKGTSVEFVEENSLYSVWLGCKIAGYSTYVPEVFVCDRKLKRDYNL